MAISLILNQFKFENSNLIVQSYTSEEVTEIFKRKISQSNIFADHIRNPKTDYFKAILEVGETKNYIILNCITCSWDNNDKLLRLNFQIIQATVNTVVKNIQIFGRKNKLSFFNERSEIRAGDRYVLDYKLTCDFAL